MMQNAFHMYIVNGKTLSSNYEQTMKNICQLDCMPQELTTMDDY